MIHKPTNILTWQLEYNNLSYIRTMYIYPDHKNHHISWHCNFDTTDINDYIDDIDLEKLFHKEQIRKLIAEKPQEMWKHHWKNYFTSEELQNWEEIKTKLLER